MADRRIMILEDEAIIAWDIEAELESRGEVVAGVAGHAAGAMALLEAGGVTAAILDINLGGETSYGVAEACQARGIGVIFLTGDPGEERPETLRQIEVVAKPVNFELLMAALRRLDG